MKILPPVLLLFLFSVQAQAAILVFNPDGTFTTKSTLADAATSADAAGKTVVVTSPQNVTTAIAWPADRRLKFENASYVTFDGAGALTGLKESRPEWFAANTIPGVTNMTKAINNAIKASVGPVLFEPTTYATTSPILMLTNTRLIGSGAGDYGRGLGITRLTSIRPLPSFSGTAVIKADAANVNSKVVYILGIGISDLTIDAYNIKSSHTIGIELRSASNIDNLTNIRIINSDIGSYVYIGISANVGALQSDGVIFDNLYTLSDNTTTSMAADPGVVVEAANEVAFRDSKIQRSYYTSRTIGAHVRSTRTYPVNGVTFSGCSFTGVEDGIRVESLAGAGQGPRHVRVHDNTFEGVKNGMKIVGTPTAPAQFNTFGPGNRIQATFPGGSQVSLGAFAYSNTVITDEYVGYGSDRTNKLVFALENSLGNTILAPPASVTDSGTNNVIMGRDNASMKFNNMYSGEALIRPRLLNDWVQYAGVNRSTIGYYKDPFGTVHLQGHATGGTVGYATPIFVLPTGYLPAKTKQFVVPSHGAYGQLLIDSNGNVSLEAGSNSYVALDGVSFRAGD